MIYPYNPLKMANAFTATQRLIAATLAVSLLVSPALSQSPAPAPVPAGAAKPAAPGAPTRYLPSRFSARAATFYSAVWGVDSMTVKAAESGELIRFSYRVLSADKARTLNDKKAEAFLIVPDIGIRLSVPSLEKVGQLRQSSTPESGKFYWMAFSNPGRRVKPGDRVNVVIGQFHVDGLIVE
jgi:hypothetical protein